MCIQFTLSKCPVCPAAASESTRWQNIVLRWHQTPGTPAWPGRPGQPRFLPQRFLEQMRRETQPIVAVIRFQHCKHTRVRHFTAGFQVPDRQRGDKCSDELHHYHHLQSLSKGTFAASQQPFHGNRFFSPPPRIGLIVAELALAE